MESQPRLYVAWDTGTWQVSGHLEPRETQVSTLTSTSAPSCFYHVISLKTSLTFPSSHGHHDLMGRL